MMRRRELLRSAAACALGALPVGARAQAKRAPTVIGWLDYRAPETDGGELAAFKEGLAALGLKEGAQIVIEQRWARGRSDRLPALAVELAQKKPALIVTNPRNATVAAAKALPGIPLVQASGGSLLEAGLAASLARPGGMVTGLVNLSADLVEKRIELLHEIVPNLRQIGFLQDPNSIGGRTYIENAQRAAGVLKLRAVFAEAARAEALPAAFARLKTEGVQALVVLPSSWFGAERPRIAQLALESRLPLIGGSARLAEAGALIGYGLERDYNFRRAAWYVDQILKGAKPGDLPIEQPAKFELVVNLKTAKALGIPIPPVVMVRADRVIQ